MGRSTTGSIASSVSELLLQPSLLHSAHARDACLPVLPPMTAVCVDSGHGLHPFTENRFNAGAVRLASIVDAYSCSLFNYRVAVLQDGARPELRTAHSRKAGRGFLDNVSLPWGQWWR